MNLAPFIVIGAGDEARTRDPQLGKLMLYQLSYTRKTTLLYAFDANCARSEKTIIDSRDQRFKPRCSVRNLSIA